MPAPRRTGKPVFISYSGPLSRASAFAVRRLLEQTLGVDAFVAEVSVDAGERWLSAIEAGLKHARVAVLCMTRENLYRPWVYFEAGGAALRGARVIPLLVGLTPGELPSPLSLYQARTTSQDDLWRMVEEIRVAVGADLPPVEPGRFQEAWQAFHDEVPDDPVPYTRWDSVLRAEQLLDTGITHAWKQRKDATALMLQDIAGAGQSITMIARVYLSELVKDDAFSSVLTRWAQRGGPAERAVTLIQSDPEETGLMAEQYATENQRPQWRDVGRYADHVREKGAFTADLVEGALRAGLALRTSGPGAVRLTQGRVSGSLLPWCFLEIDRRVVYVSFYRRQGTSTYGTNAPTLRAERPEKGDARFFDQLVIEAAALAEGAGTVSSKLVTGER